MPPPDSRFIPGGIGWALRCSCFTRCGRTRRRFAASLRVGRGLSSASTFRATGVRPGARAASIRRNSSRPMPTSRWRRSPANRTSRWCLQARGWVRTRHCCSRAVAPSACAQLSWRVVGDLAGGGGAPPPEDRSQRFEKSFRAPMKRALGDAAGGPDPRIEMAEHDPRPPDYAQHFAERAKHVILVGGEGEAAPWWEAVAFPREGRACARRSRDRADLLLALTAVGTLLDDRFSRFAAARFQSRPRMAGRAGAASLKAVRGSAARVQRARVVPASAKSSVASTWARANGSDISVMV